MQLLKDDVEFIKSTADIVEGIIGKQSEKIEQAQKENTQEGEVKYSLSDNAEADVERALKDKNYTEDVKLTINTPTIIASQKGAKDYPMLMKASHIRENIFTEDEAKQAS